MAITEQNQSLSQIVIAIDGPAGSGKTTTARDVAHRLGLLHLDTGAMYRCVTLKAIRAGMDPSDAEAVSALAESVNIRLTEGDDGSQKVLLDGEDVTVDIRKPDVTAHVSMVSTHTAVRRSMVRRQRQLADGGGLVLEGRDIGSVVLPSADVKIYLDAATDVRAARRGKELEERGTPKPLDAVRADIEERDHKDSTREVSPLKIPVGAHIVDTTALTIEEQVRQVIDIARRTAERRRALVIPRGKRNPWRRQRMVWRLSRGLIMILLKVLWGLRVVRKDNLDYGENFIFASNHHSNADPPVIGSTCPREIHFVAKATLFTWSRAFAWLIAMYNAIPIRRGQFDREAMDRCLELLANGESVLIFPEGGRQRGPELGPARPGVGYLALNSGCSVVPIYVDGTQSMLRALLRRPRLTIRLGRPIRLDRTVIERSRNAEGYREFSHMVMAAIQALRDENVA